MVFPSGWRKNAPPSSCENQADLIRYHLGVERSVLRRRITQRPNNVRFEELRRMLESYGWVVQRVRGSHYVFGRGGAIFPVPHHGGTVKAPYVRQALALTEGEDDAEE